MAILPAGRRGRLDGEQHLLAHELLPEELSAGPGAGLVDGGLRVAGAAPGRPWRRHIAQVQLTLLGPARARLAPDRYRIAG